MSDSSYQSMMLSSQRKVAELESQLAVVTADSTALLNSMKQNCFQPGDLHDVCIFCDVYSPRHDPDCILAAEHPGSRLLERLEAAEKLFQFCDEKLGSWLSAAISDDVSCKEFKDVCEGFFEALAAYEKRRNRHE